MSVAWPSEEVGHDGSSSLAAVPACRSVLPAWQHSAHGAALGAGMQCLGLGGEGKETAPELSYPSPQHGGMELGAPPAAGCTKQGHAPLHTDCMGSTGRSSTWKELGSCRERDEAPWEGFALVIKLPCKAVTLCSSGQGLKSSHIGT